MEINSFLEQYKDAAWKEKIFISCTKNLCGNIEETFKQSAIRNINKNGSFHCRSCSYTEEGKKKIAAATSYKRSEETKKKMSEAKKAFYLTDKGKEFKEGLSKLTSIGHSKNKYENSKRQGWYPSTKNNKLMFYGSSYELRLCWLLDKDDTIESYETQIGYECNDRGRCLDFLLHYNNGEKVAIEVKPKNRLNEEKNILQLSDSKQYALSNNWKFKIFTEDDFSMNYAQLRNWADTYRETITGIDYTAHRLEMDRKKAKKHYDNKIAIDKIEIYCEFCKCNHEPLNLTYKKNIERNGRYICEKEGGSISGKKPKKKKENPYASEGKKQCTECSDIKLLEEFGFDKSRSDGYANKCKHCRIINKATL